MAQDILSLLVIGISAFAATNIDDIFVLMMFFSYSSSSHMTFQSMHIILGQYLGIGSLIAISIFASFISLAIPTHIIGLLGIIPIVIGVNKIVRINKKKEGDQVTSSNLVLKEKTNNRKEDKSYLLSSMTVAAMTFSNGSDNIGVYTPLFAKYNNSISQIAAFVAVFMAMTAVWCIAAYYLVNHPIFTTKIRHTSRIVLPFVLIGLGIYILSTSIPNIIFRF